MGSERTKRSMPTKTIQSFVNLVKELEVTECSSPILNIYLNEELVFSNSTGMIKEYAPPDSINVHIKVDSGHFMNLLPAKKKFLMSLYLYTYYESIEECNKWGGKLLTVKSEEEHNEIIEIMQKNQFTDYWTSGNRLHDRTKWYWANKEPFNYTNWFSGEKSDLVSNENCMKIRHPGGSWYAFDCKRQLHFICEIPSESVEVPPIIKIYFDENLVHPNLPLNGNFSEQSNIVIVKLGLNGDSIEDHSTKFQLVRKNSSQEAASEQRLISPESFHEEDFNGIDIRIEHIKQEGLSCQKDKVYHVYTEKMMCFVDAEKFCQNHSMQLVSIQNEKHQLEIEKVILNLNLDHFYWTSGHLAPDGASWYWNENEMLTYSNWDSGEPNNLGGDEKCIEIFVPQKTVKWNDQDCGDKNNIICESLTEPYWQLTTN